MANYIKVTCPTCGYQWHEDLDKHQAQKVIYRGEKKKIKVEEYRFQCQQDGTYVITKVTIEE